ncbi:2-(R)-hydroxypropyl-CoM dehydrogenase [Streptomyces sp. YIM 130001]|uniref:SDR family NAD(P)-dependent oxidoreductase n=1 Tax=Streptomyces sp. YIM 130001 TaxID=2259644 RepID=UPI000E6593A6|nr:glucose 1-dehydrogenase [Streptomyces sp. YIM 130001]RII19538.1 2-(R)-hydroxypropyl-CoM dehydrogenase [Streptomyces sp. YIM 130001]
MTMDGRCAVVSGAGSGIGRAIALRLASAGAKVVVAGDKAGPLEETVGLVAADGGEAFAVRCDVSREDDVIALMDRTVERFGRLDVLVNNAGVEFAKRVEDTTSEEWDWLMDVNLKGVFLCAKHALPVMRGAGGGVIVNIASELALVGSEAVAAYSASKAGVLQLTRALAVDHAGDGVRVNALSPGVILTALLQTALDSTGDPDKRRREFEERTLLGRLGTPEEAAEAALFLASDQSSYMTGGNLVLDGGWTAH